MDTFGDFWIHLDTFGDYKQLYKIEIRIHLNTFGYTWIHLDTIKNYMKNCNLEAFIFFSKKLY